MKFSGKMWLIKRAIPSISIAHSWKNHVGDKKTMWEIDLPGNKIKGLTSVNHTTKTIHNHHKCVRLRIFWPIKKNGVHVLRCLHHEQKWKLWKFSLSFLNNKNVLFLQFAIFSETIPCLLFQSSSGCPPICSFFFGFPCDFAKVNLVFIVTFDHEHFHLSNPVYLAFRWSFQLKPLSWTIWL